MFLKGTAFGIYVESVSKLTKEKVMKKAFSNSVLEQMKELNNNQLDDGLYSDNQPTPDYSPYTIQLKKRLGKIWQHMTFEDTGKTRDSIKYTYSGGRLKVEMNDYHDLTLNPEYSPNIIGLTPNSIEDVQSEILENIQEVFTPNV